MCVTAESLRGRESMATAVTERCYTPEDLLALPEAGRYELLDGHLVERHLGATASDLAARLLRLLGFVTDAQARGLLCGADCGYHMFADDPHRVRYADGACMCRGRFPSDTPPEGHGRIPPDLAIAAVSPHDTARAVEEKVAQWLSTGIQQVWVMSPDTHRLHVHRQDGTVSTLRAADLLSGAEVIPGFQCRGAEIFQGLGEGVSRLQPWLSAQRWRTFVWLEAHRTAGGEDCGRSRGGGLLGRRAWRRRAGRAAWRAHGPAGSPTGGGADLR